MSLNLSYIYVEPKTGLVYAQEPRERNTYCLIDNPYNRAALRQLIGPALITFLESAERVARG